MNIIDITIPLSEKTPVWEGDGGVSIKRVETIGEGSDFNVSRIELGVHAGTHVDGPFHVFKGGKTVDQIPLDSLIGRVQVVEIPDGTPVIDSTCLMNLEFDPQVERVLFKTSNSNFWEIDPFSFRKDYLAFNMDGAEFMAGLGIKLLGLDYFSISVFEDLKPPHAALLEKGIVLLENIDLRNVAPGFYTLMCLPIKLIGTDGAPVRAVLIND